MFQRQTRQTFPLPVILLAAMAAAALLIFALKKSRSATAPQPSESNEEAKRTGSLFPDEIAAMLREYPSYKPDLKAWSMALEQARESAAAHSRSGNFGFSAPWTVEGPRNIGARVNSIAVHPTNQSILYIGFSRGGVWKTLNGGQTWQPIFDGQANLNIGDVVLDPQNPDIVYVGTGDLNIGSYVGVGNGLWKSSNGGQTWAYLGLENVRIISKIIVHPTQSNTIYVAAMGLPFERTPDRGLYKTTNGGQTWQKVLYIGNETGITDVVMSPDNPNELFAASWDRIRTNFESFVSGYNGKIWKTTDGGTNWQQLTNGLPDGKQGRIGLANTPQNPNLLYALYVDSTSSLGWIYRSTDRGASWTPTDSIPRRPWGGDIMGNFGWYFGKIWINPFDQEDIFVGGVEHWRSLDGGTNWYQFTPDWWEYTVHADQHDMAFLNANTIILGNDGGLYKTSDSGNSWQDIENIPTTQFYRVAVNPHEPEYYYGGAQDNGTTGGNSTISEWPRLYGGDGFQAVFHPTDPNIIYYEIQNGGIVGTTDGNFFDSGTNGIENGDRMHWDMPYMISQHDPEFMYTGTHRLYQGLGHVTSWFPVSDDLTDGVLTEPRFHTISTLHESPLDADLVYVGTTDANVWRGSPNSQSWTNITAGLPERYVSSVKASPSNANRVFVTHTGYRDNDNSPRIHRSDDRGATWKPIQGNLPNLAINDVIIYPGHQDSVIFVGTDGGVYGTLDGGQNWERLGSGFPVVAVFDLEINPATKRLVAGTYARSIMTFPLDSLQLDGNVSTFNPGNNQGPELTAFPTLASERLNIVLENFPAGQNIELLVVNLAGQQVHHQMLRGSQSQSSQIDLQNFSPGTYWLFARAKGKVLGHRKFVKSK